MKPQIIKIIMRFQMSKTSSAWISELNHRAHSPKSRAVTSKAVGHFLRQMNTIDRKQGKEWDIDAKHGAWFIDGNGEKVFLDELSSNEIQEIKESILNHTFDDFLKNDDEKFKEKFDKLASKVTKLKSNLNKNKDSEVFKSITKIKKRAITDEEFEAKKEEILNSDYDRKPQKIKSLTRYKDLTQEMYGTDKADARKTAFQEFQLKFPSLENGTIPDEKYIEFAEGYYKDTLPNYKVIISTFHNDENYINDGIEVGKHCHSFISAKNILTGQYDIRETQKKNQTEYIKNNRDEFPELTDELLDEMSKPYSAVSLSKVPTEQQEYHNSKVEYFNGIQGKAKQQIYFNYFNEKVSGYGVKLEKNVYDTPELQALKEKMKIDSKKNKSDREFNHKNQELDKEKRELEHTKKLNKKANNDLKKYEILTAEAATTLLNTEKKTENITRVAEIKFKSMANNYIESNTTELKSVIETINSPDFQQKIQAVEQDENWYKVFKTVDKLIKDDNNKMIKKAHEFLKKNIIGYESLFETCKGIFFNQYEIKIGKMHELDTSKKGNQLDKMTNKITNKLSSLKDDLPFGKGMSDAQVNGYLDGRDEEEQTTSKIEGTFGADDFVKMENDRIKNRYKK